MLLLANLATLATSVFTGAAIFVSLVEHPARLRCSTEAAVMHWRPSYARATVMQASLALAGTSLALAAWASGAGATWLVAAALLGAVVPYTLIVMLPTNKRLADGALDPKSPEARELLLRWGRLHSARSISSLAALMMMLFGR